MVCGCQAPLRQSHAGGAVKEAVQAFEKAMALVEHPFLIIKNLPEPKD